MEHLAKYLADLGLPPDASLSDAIAAINRLDVEPEPDEMTEDERRMDRFAQRNDYERKV